MTRTLHVIEQAGETAQAVVLKLSVDAVRHEAQSDDDQHAWLLFGGEPMRDAIAGALDTTLIDLTLGVADDLRSVHGVCTTSIRGAFALAA